MKEIRILHLSDIHLGTPELSVKYRVQLETDLTQNLSISQLDYLVISGDSEIIQHLTNTPQGLIFLNGLINTFQIKF